MSAEPTPPDVPVSPVSPVPPAGHRFRRRRWGAGLAFLVATGGIGTAATIPLPLVRLRPGAGIELARTITIDGDTTPINGEYRGLTIRLDDVTPLEWLQVKVTRSKDEVVSRDDVFPPQTNRGTYNAEQRVVFADSARIASAVAERALDLPVTVTGHGVTVSSVAPGSAAMGHLAIGDVIIAVGTPAARDVGALTPIAMPSELRPALDALATASPAAASATVRLAVRREGSGTGADAELVDITLAPIPGTDRIGLGVTVGPAGLTVALPVEVEVDGGKVGGPSAGLLTALMVYDSLSPEDLAAGRRVTGTGTLDIDGIVGPIGGIAEKARSALSARATVFVAPAQQAAEARSVVGDRMVVVGVATFDEAVTALRSTATPRAATDGAAAGALSTPTTS